MKTLIKLILHARPAVFCLMVFLFSTGVFSYISLPRENAPDITIPYVFISTSYEGVSPQEIENLVTIQLEKKFRGLDKVKEIKSESVEGSSNITIEFYPDQKLDDAVQKVKDKIDLARKDLPDDIDEPIVSEINLSTDIPVMSIAFFGSDSPNTLKKIVEDIKDRVESVSGVLEAKIFGDLEREIRVEIDVDRLNAYGIPVTNILSTISRENKTSSAGNLEMLGGKFQIRVTGEFSSPDEINNIIIAGNTNRPVYLSDIAKIKDSFKDTTSISRINGKRCISLMVQKRSGQNVIQITKAVKNVLEEERKNLPEGIDYLITSDLSKDTYRMLRELENNIVSGMFLVLAVLFLVLGLRNSLFVGFAIPMSMLITFSVLSSMGITLNMIVLFSLILVLGMLVDNAIVIVENSFRYRNLGNNSFNAALLGASEVAMPIIGATATTVVAFLPLLLWPDVIGEFMWYLPVTIIISLLSSLFVAMVINPIICSLWLKKSDPKQHGFFMRLRSYGNQITLSYEKSLRICIEHPKTLFAIFLLVFLLISLSYFRFGAGVELFPNVEPRRARVNIEYPEGARIEKTDKATLEIEKRIAAYPEIKYYLTTVGSSGDSYFSGGQRGTNYASILLEFNNFEQRQYPSSIVVEAIRMHLNGFQGLKIEKGKNNEISIEGSNTQIQALKLALQVILGEKIKNIPIKDKVSSSFVLNLPSDQFETLKVQINSSAKPFPGAKITAKKEKEGPPTGAPILIEISGEDYRTLAELTAQIEKKISDIEGISDVKNDLIEGLPEIRFIPNRIKLAIFNLDTSTVATFIRAAINGLEISKYREGEDEYDITIRLPEHQRTDTNALSRMMIPNPNGFSIPLSNLGHFTYTEGYGTIKRKNQARTISIQAEPQDGYSADDILKKIPDKIAEIKIPAGYKVNLTGENKDQDENFKFLLNAFFIASGLILIILVLQFNSILLPIIIFSSVAFSMIGVFAGLLVFNMRFSIIMTGLGIISLAGIVVNNAIVLLDFAMQLQKNSGLSVKEAAVQAGKLRLRPVLLTAVTTVLGLIPMAIGWSLEIHSFPPKFIAGAESSQWWAPMAIVVIVGLTVSTLLTLFLAPSLFCVFRKNTTDNLEDNS